MAQKAKPVPAGYSTVTPYLVVNDAARALDFYKQAFGAEEKMRMAGPQGKIGHAEIKIGDSMIMLADEMPGAGTRSPHSLNGTTGGVFLYVKDVDAVFQQAVNAGAKADMPPADMFWGDRMGHLADPFGQKWTIATHIKDMTPEEMQKRMQAEMAKYSQQHAQHGAQQGGGAS